jgi:hypothetical protein
VVFKFPTMGQCYETFYRCKLLPFLLMTLFL